MQRSARLTPSQRVERMLPSPVACLPDACPRARRWLLASIWNTNASVTMSESSATQPHALPGRCGRTTLPDSTPRIPTLPRRPAIICSWCVGPLACSEENRAPWRTVHLLLEPVTHGRAVVWSGDRERDGEVRARARAQKVAQSFFWPTSFFPAACSRQTISLVHWRTGLDTRSTCSCR